MANIFPRWSNAVPAQLLIALLLLGTAVTAGVTYYFTPKYTVVGYSPVQPVAYSHYLHVDQLGLDCRYCHTYVDRSEHANIPDAATCINCHNQILMDSPALAPVRESYATGDPVPWVKVHRMPDYVYFNHAVHVNRGISCVECHGQINEMEVVYHAKSLSMAFCLDCHRNPENFVRPLDKVYDLNWKPESAETGIEAGKQMVHDWHISPPKSCSGCHQ